MTRFVFDASVIVADARPSEPFHPDAHRLLQCIWEHDHTIQIPIIALAEVGAAISRGANDLESAEKLISLWQRLPHVTIIEVDTQIGILAAKLASQHKIRGCDAVYVALASITNASLVTLDGQQRSRVPPTVAAYLPSEALAIC